MNCIRRIRRFLAGLTRRTGALPEDGAAASPALGQPAAAATPLDHAPAGARLQPPGDQQRPARLASHLDHGRGARLRAVGDRVPDAGRAAARGRPASWVSARPGRYSMTTTTPSAALIPVVPVFTSTERLALAGFLAGHSGLTREAYELDLRPYTSWCHQHHLRLFQARRADIECFARDLEARGRARATITRRLCTIAGFYRYAVEEDLLDHSPAAHVRRPRLDYESHATGLDRNELGALLVAAGLGMPAEQGRHHSTGTTHRAGDRSGGRRARGWADLLRPRWAAAGPARRRPGRASGGPPRGHYQAGRAAHAAARIHHRCPRRRSAASGRAGSSLARRPTHDDALRPGPGQP